MSTNSANATPSELKQYLILIPDHPNTLALRRATQPAHIQRATPLIDAGRLPYFGVMLARHPPSPRARAATSSSEEEINGSLMVLHAESEEAVREMLDNDPYAKQGVWDVANARVVPFRAG